MLLYKGNKGGGNKVDCKEAILNGYAFGMIAIGNEQVAAVSILQIFSSQFPAVIKQENY